MIVIELKATGGSKIIVDGRDIAQYVTSVNVRHTSGTKIVDGKRVPGPYLPEVDLTLVGPIYVSVDGKVKIGAEYADAALLPRIAAAPHVQSDSGEDE